MKIIKDLKQISNVNLAIFQPFTRVSKCPRYFIEFQTLTFPARSPLRISALRKYPILILSP